MDLFLKKLKLTTLLIPLLRKQTSHKELIQIQSNADERFGSMIL